MYRLSSSETKSLLKAVKTLFSSDSPEILSKTVASVRQVTDTDFVALDCIRTNKSGREIVVGYIDPADAVSQQDKEILPLVIGTDPLWIEAINKNISAPKKLSDYITFRQFRDTAAYIDFYSHYGIEEQLTTDMTIPGGQELLLTLGRGSIRFAERDRKLIHSLKPFILTALTNAHLLERIEGSLELLRHFLESDDKAIAHFTDGLANMKVSEAAHKLLYRYFPDWSAFTSILPNDVEQWIKQEEKRIKAIDNVYIPSQPFNIERKFSSLSINLLIDPNSGQRVLILEEKPLCSSPELLRTLGLTQRESEVLFWVAEGKTNGEIAILCNISARTVQKHLEHIFQKLGIETRTSAVRIVVKTIGLQNS